ncbi:MAG: methionine adenosyltransferase domain-containing protein, partial [Oscillospiraceae bacterium]|nr:methionine adenosyltransferase domain-containing protein [Oscillospiraceae bacterium]
SGKDPTKVDRSAAYAARWVARNLVAAGLAKKCEVQLAYAIGVANPVSIRVDSFGTSAYDDERLANAVKKVFDLRPASIIKTLDLRRPIYRAISNYGQMGRNGMPWEEENRVNELKAALQ